MPTSKIKFPRILTEEEIVCMLKAAEQNPRDLMLLKCLYYLGLKSSELLSVRVGDIDIGKSIVRVGGGKDGSDKAREVMIPGAFTFELEKYLAGKQGLAFSGRASEGSLSDRHIRRIVKQYACLAEVRNCEEIKPHTLRVSYANHLRKDGIPVKAIQEMMGHARKETTSMYTHGLSRPGTNQAHDEPETQPDDAGSA